MRGLKRELVEDVAEGSVRESFFMLREWGLLGGKMKESVSEVVDERVEEEAGLSVDMLVGFWFAKEGVSMRRWATGQRFRTDWEDNMVDCGRGVAVSMFWKDRKRHAGVYDIEVLLVDVERGTK